MVGSSSGRATSSGAKTTGWPGASSRGAASCPTRIRGPCKSTSTATGWPARSAAQRTLAIQRARSSGVPCEALMRMTFAPASSNAAIASSDPVAGPIVATILVRRITLALRCVAGE